MKSKSTDFVQYGGGLDLSTPALNMEPGAALVLVNFEPELDGGYRRINGYERCDGRAAPSDAIYYTVEVADASGIAAGATLTGASSGATSNVIIKDGNTLGVTVLAGGPYTLSEVANGTTITAIEARSGQADIDTDNIWQLAAEDYYRDLIGALPGTGNVLGAAQFGATKYAFRSDGANAVMYKSSASGWTVVPFYQYLLFDAGVSGADTILIEGATITGASATGTIKKIIKNAGSWSGGTASGYMVVDVTTGAFVDNDPIQVSAVTKATADGASANIALTTGGKFQFIQHNFYGSAGTEYLYGCDGLSFAWEFDGTILTPIFFPAPDKNASWNTPKYISAHGTYLYLSFPGGQLANSSLGEPLVFSALLGAVEFGLGSECTGLASRAGSVLAIYTKDGRTYGLYGTTSADWQLKIISESFGAKDYTVESLGTIYAVDDKGIVPLERVQAYGDFEGSTVSRKVRSIMDTHKNGIVQAFIVKERNQYRIAFDDGTIMVMSDDRSTQGAQQAFSTLKYTDIPTCFSNFDDENGNEVILFGDSSGFVYEAEKGYTFDGDAIEYAFRTPYAHQKSPQLRKSYHKCYTDIEADRPFSLKLFFDVSYGSPYNAPNTGKTTSFQGGGGFYDQDNWDEIYWDAETFSSQGAVIAGTGTNISFLYYGKSKYTRPFTIQSREIHYLQRRMKRATG